MSIYKGSQKIKELYFGGVKIGKVYKGGTLVYQSCPYKAGQVLFESATVGTNSLNLLANGVYKVWIVGGGAGGAYKRNSSMGITLKQSKGGGSGACFIGTIRISKGSFNITIGAGGAGRSGSTDNHDGGQSNLGTLITAGGGVNINGGTLTLNTSVLSSEISKNGNNGGVSSSSSCSGGASLYNGYGAGGKVSGDTPSSGTGGYVKVQFVSS